MGLSKEERAGVNRGRARLRRLIEENELPNPFTKKQLYERDARFVHGKQYGETLPVMIKNSEIFPLADGRLELNRSDGSELNLPAKRGNVVIKPPEEETGSPIHDPPPPVHGPPPPSPSDDDTESTDTNDGGNETVSTTTVAVKSRIYRNHVKRLREKTGHTFLGHQVGKLLGLVNATSVYPVLGNMIKDGYIERTGKKGEYRWIKKDHRERASSSTDDVVGSSASPVVITDPPVVVSEATASDENTASSVPVFTPLSPEEQRLEQLRDRRQDLEEQLATLTQEMEPLESGIRQKRVAEALRVFQLLDPAGKLAFFDLVRARECPNETNDDEEAS